MKQRSIYSKLGTVLLTTSIFFCAKNISAQVNISFEAAKLQMAYKNQTSLSFDVSYTYAMEATPLVITDSSAGSFKLSGANYWGIIDSSEFMQNERYSITLYKPDKIMSVNNRSDIYPQVADFSSFDNLVGKNNYTASFTTSGILKTITLRFTDKSFPYKDFSVSYDSTTNLVSQIRYVIKGEADEYSDSYTKMPGESSSEYIIVKADYYNYQKTNFSRSFFDTGNYFVFNGSVCSPQPKYSDYEIFVGSPNVLK